MSDIQLTEIEAENLADAYTIIEDLWGDDMSWADLGPHVRVFAPSMAPDEINEEPDEPACLCPADLLARGGFRGSCPAH